MRRLAIIPTRAVVGNLMIDSANLLMMLIVGLALEDFYIWGMTIKFSITDALW
jgi:hypothetical protein